MTAAQKINCDLVYDLCKKHFEKVNVILKFPKGTPPHLTYQWRSISTITKKFTDWNFTLEEVDLFIGVVISKSRGFEHKGLTILNDSNVLEECYEQVKILESREHQSIKVLRNCHECLYKQSKNGLLVDCLISRRKPGALTNIVTYFESGKLVKLYLAFSRPCIVALELLGHKHPDERKMCPSVGSLLYTRRCQSQDIIPQVREILGSDFYV